MTPMSPDVKKLILEDLRQEPSPDRLERVRVMVRQARDKQGNIADLEERLDQEKKDLNRILNEDLPALFQEVGILNFTLVAEGNRPQVEAELITAYNASIPEENKAKAYAWFEKQGHGDLVKTWYTIAFGMGERTQAKKLEKILKKEKIDYETKLQIHASTLKSFVRHQIGVAKKVLPQQLLGLNVLNVVKLTFQKEKRK
jgi:hypothetical protein